MFKMLKSFFEKEVKSEPNKLMHLDILKVLQDRLKVRNYLEIGVANGDSIILAGNCKKVIGVDPVNSLMHSLHSNTKIFFETSDVFFEKHDVEKEFEGKIDLAFIDGMHLFEFVLRDFINTEKYCKKDSVIVLHDTIPIDKITSSRELLPGYWTGDVFKIILILRKYRPDLKLYNISTPPIGTCIVRNTDSQNNILKENYDKILKEYMNIDYDDIKDNIEEMLDIKKYSLKNIEEIIQEHIVV